MSSFFVSKFSTLRKSQFLGSSKTFANHSFFFAKFRMKFLRNLNVWRSLHKPPLRGSALLLASAAPVRSQAGAKPTPSVLQSGDPYVIFTNHTQCPSPSTPPLCTILLLHTPLKHLTHEQPTQSTTFSNLDAWGEPCGGACTLHLPEAVLRSQSFFYRLQFRLRLQVLFFHRLRLLFLVFYIKIG